MDSGDTGAQTAKKRRHIRPVVQDLGSLQDRAEAMGMPCAFGTSAGGSTGGDCVPGSMVPVRALAGVLPP